MGICRNFKTASAPRALKRVFNCSFNRAFNRARAVRRQALRTMAPANAVLEAPAQVVAYADDAAAVCKAAYAYQSAAAQPAAPNHFTGRTGDSGSVGAISYASVIGCVGVISGLNGINIVNYCGSAGVSSSACITCGARNSRSTAGTSCPLSDLTLLTNRGL